MEIPHSHSQTLIDQLLDPLLPELTVKLPSTPGVHLTPEEFLAFRKEQEARSAKRGEIVRKTEVPRFGIVEEFRGLQVPVVYVETFWGNHVTVALQEGVLDHMAELFRLGKHNVRSDESIVERIVERLAS